MTKSIWWGLQAVFWYWWDHGVPLFAAVDTAWWHGFHLRKVYNNDLADDEASQAESAREAVFADVDYWEP